MRCLKYVRESGLGEQLITGRSAEWEELEKSYVPSSLKRRANGS